MQLVHYDVEFSLLIPSLGSGTLNYTDGTERPLEYVNNILSEYWSTEPRYTSQFKQLVYIQSSQQLKFLASAHGS